MDETLSNRSLTFANMEFTRASAAWCPVTGRAVSTNMPRIANIILAPTTHPAPIYHRFSAEQGFTAYNHDPGCYTRPGETSDYLSDLLDALETAVPSAERLKMGESYEGRDLEMFRLGAANRPTFAWTCAIHGNEADGIPGSVKAFEVLATHPDFAALRAAFTLCFWPACNPDGYYAGTRNTLKLGPHPSGVDQYINLNRVWPYYWAEYSPSADESKGDAPITCTPESQAMWDWRMEGNSGGPIALRFALDQHSTAGDGARYQSRDRCFRELEAWDLEALWADWTVYRVARALQAQRVHGPDAAPDLFVNYFRSRWRPHWHSWLSTRQASETGGYAPISMVHEHNKVALQVCTSDAETYKSASDYNLDYLVACALVMMGEMTERREGVLIEHDAATNLADNSAFEQWQQRDLIIDPIEYRPGWWKATRGTFGATTRDEHHMQAAGRPALLTPDLVMDLPDDTDVGPSPVHDAQLGSDDFIYIAATDDAGGFQFLRWDLNSQMTKVGQDPASSNVRELRFLGCTSTELAFALCGQLSGPIAATFVSIDYATWTRTTRATHTTPLVAAAVAWVADTSKGYILGGYTATATPSRKVWEFNRTTWALAELGTDLLTTADAGGVAVAVTSGALDGSVVMLGGASATAGYLKVVTLDPSGPTATEALVDITGLAIPPEVVIYSGAAWDNTDERVLLYGGEHASTGAVYPAIYALSWDGAAWSIEQLDVTAGYDDEGEAEDASGAEFWCNPWSRWRACYMFNAETADRTVALVGGRHILPDGTDDPGPYRSSYLHLIDENTIGRPEDTTYGYFRYNVHFDKGTDTAMSASWSMRGAGTGETHSYARINNAGGDSVSGDFKTRRVRSYYQHPPRSFWWREQASLDWAMADPRITEDEVRCYMRGYRDGQPLLADAPMVTKGSLWPSSWSPIDVPRAGELAHWSQAVDPRWLRLDLCWLPQAPFLAFPAGLTAERRLVVVGEGEDAYTLELWATGTDLNERAYFRDQTKGPAEPTLELRCVKSEDLSYTSCAVPVYWGGYPKDIGMSRYDSPIGIEIWQHPAHGRGLVVRNGPAVGWAIDSVRLLSTFWGMQASVSLLGGGWWAEPRAGLPDPAFCAAYAATANETGALLIGDRDPTYGQVTSKAAFRFTEDFERANNSNLGDDWNIIAQTGNGWGVHSTKARGASVGWERWIAYPYLRDAKVFADVSISANSCRVGLFCRMHWKLAGAGWVNGYLGTLYRNSGGTTYLKIEELHWAAGVQVRTEIASAVCTYTLDEVLELEFGSEGSTITLIAWTLGGGVRQAVSTTDATHALPGAFGLCCETPNNSTYVYADNVHAAPSDSVKIRITE